MPPSSSFGSRRFQLAYTKTIPGGGVLFGQKVSLSGDGSLVAILAPYRDYNAGRARIFSYNASTEQWIQLGQDLVKSTYDSAGSGLSLSNDGSTVAIGNGAEGCYYGHVRVFSFDASTEQWMQLGQDLDGENRYDQFGHEVSLSSEGSTVAIAAIFHDNDILGHVRVFSFNASTEQWTQLGQDLDGENAKDRSGTSVSLSDDGRTVSIGSIWNDGNGNNSGHVRVFSYDASTELWAQVGQDLDGENAYDLSGMSTGLSSDGNTVVIGAPSNDGIKYRF